MVDALKLTVSFPYSNQAYCQIFGGENQQCLLQGMRNIFEHIGKVPNRILFDNLSSVLYQRYLAYLSLRLRSDR